MVRARIRLDTTKEVTAFVQQMNSDGSVMKYVVEDFDGTHRVSARSYLGMIYASAEFGDHIYLVNDTDDGYFPHFVDDFRHPGDDSASIHY